MCPQKRERTKPHVRDAVGSIRCGFVQGAKASGAQIAESLRDGVETLDRHAQSDTRLTTAAASWKGGVSQVLEEMVGDTDIEPVALPCERYFAAGRLKAIIFSLGCATIDRISPKLLWNGSFQQA